MWRRGAGGDRLPVELIAYLENQFFCKYFIRVKLYDGKFQTKVVENLITDKMVYNMLA